MSLITFESMRLDYLSKITEAPKYLIVKASITWGSGIFSIYNAFNEVEGVFICAVFKRLCQGLKPVINILQIFAVSAVTTRN